MYQQIPVRNSIRPATPRRGRGLVLILMAFISFAVSPLARAADGGLPNENTAEGDDALASITTGGFDTAVGYRALYANDTGSQNTAVGAEALLANTSGTRNTAAGAFALRDNTTGERNTAIGNATLTFNTTGFENTAIGNGAMFSNTTGTDNTAVGTFALLENTAGNSNTAIGFDALPHNKTGDSNTAIGLQALERNTTGNFNTATGFQALAENNGGHNTATGFQALENNMSGRNNTGIGVLVFASNQDGNNNTASGVVALGGNFIGNNNTADGFNALLNNTGSNNIGLGFNAGRNLTTGDNNVDIGAYGVAGESNTIRIGRAAVHKATHIAGIYGTVLAGGVGVIVNAQGQLGIVQSSARFKDGIKPMDQASEVILALKPVTFHYKPELDPDGIPQFGLVAEEVEKVNSALVARDADGKVNTVRYEAVNAMLLNEFLKEHRKVQELEATVAQQKNDFDSMLAEQQKQINALALGLQKVNTPSN